MNWTSIIIAMLSVCGGAVGREFIAYLRGRTKVTADATASAITVLEGQVRLAFAEIAELRDHVGHLEDELKQTSSEKHAESNRANAAEMLLFVAEASGCGHDGSRCRVAMDWVRCRREADEVRRKQSQAQHA